MPVLTIFHGCDAYEVTYQDAKILHIDKLMGDSQVRREILYEKLPPKVREEVELTINLEDE